MKANELTLTPRTSAPEYGRWFSAPVKKFDTIIISDLHLGSRICKVEELYRFLKNTKFKRLIINGDVFDSINMKRLSKKHWKVLTLLRKLTATKKGREVIWLRGNHDGEAEFISNLIGISFRSEYSFKWNDKKILVFHGDIFDKFVSKHPLVSDIADNIYRFILVGPGTKRLGKWLKRASKKFIRNTGKVHEGAIQYARRKKADIVICGHTHHAEETPAKVKGISYYNSGSWTGEHAHFIGMTKSEIKTVELV